MLTSLLKNPTEIPSIPPPFSRHPIYTFHEQHDHPGPHPSDTELLHERCSPPPWQKSNLFRELRIPKWFQHHHPKRQPSRQPNILWPEHKTREKVSPLWRGGQRWTWYETWSPRKPLLSICEWSTLSSYSTSNTTHNTLLAHPCQRWISGKRHLETSRTDTCHKRPWNPVRESSRSPEWSRHCEHRKGQKNEQGM